MSLKKGSTLSMSVQARPDSLATPLDLDSKPKDFSTIKELFEPPKPGQAFQTYDATEVAFPGLKDRWVKKAEGIEEKNQKDKDKKTVFQSLFWKKYEVNNGTTIVMKNQEVIMMGAVNYLGMAHHPKVVNDSLEALKKHGAGGIGSRYSNGYLELHEKLDYKVENFLEKEGAVFFNSGFMANLGVFSAIEKNAVIFSDKENHLSIYDGCRLSGLKYFRFRHNDPEDLDNLLQKVNNNTPKWIVLVGTFGATGENIKLKEIVAVAKKHQAKIYLDDAHAIGIYGKKHKGLSEFYNVYNEIDLLMTSFQMAFGNIGAVICGKDILLDKIRLHSRPYMFSFAIPANNVAGILAALDIIQSSEGDFLIKQLHKNSSELRKGLKELNFPIISSDSQIVSIRLENENVICDFANRLLENGIWTQKYVHPAVPLQKANIRFTCMATHTEAQIIKTIETVKKIGKQCGII